MQNFDAPARDRLVQQCRRLAGELKQKAAKGASYEALEGIRQELRRSKEAYFDVLPRVPLSRCPHTNELLVRAFDPVGVDGLWWQEGQLIEFDEPAPPPTFQVLLGALNMNGKPPQGGPSEALVGPEVPYVIPRILEMPEMMAVVSEVRMANDYIAYPIAYFSTESPPPGSLTQSWRESQYSFQTPAGTPAWTVKTDPWDFDLERWVEVRKLQWVDPGDEDMQVRSGSWAEYPFRAVTGRREQQIIEGSDVWTEPPPSGEELEPFE